MSLQRILYLLLKSSVNRENHFVSGLRGLGHFLTDNVSIFILLYCTDTVHPMESGFHDLFNAETAHLVIHFIP